MAMSHHILKATAEAVHTQDSACVGRIVHALLTSVYDDTGKVTVSAWNDECRKALSELLYRKRPHILPKYRAHSVATAISAVHVQISGHEHSTHAQAYFHRIMQTH